MPEKPDRSISGWLFFHPDRSNLSFVPDVDAKPPELPWKILLKDDVLTLFIATFSPRRARQVDTRLEGYYVEAPERELRRFFNRYV